eukprot:gene23204-31525_t
MKCCGKKMNRNLSTLTPPTQNQFFLEKNLGKMDRESFIAAIIAELEEQNKQQLPVQQRDVPSSSGSLIRSGNYTGEEIAFDAYKKLCFDYPLISFENSAAEENKNYAASLNRLTMEIRNAFINGAGSDSMLRTIFNLNPVFIHNLKVYIPSIITSDQVKSSSANIEEVFLCHRDLKSLSKVLSSDMTAIYDSIGSLPATSDRMGWAEVSEKFKLFVLESSASAVLHEFSQGNNSRQYELKGLDATLSSIAILSGLLFPAPTSKQTSRDSSTSAMTLKMYLLEALQERDNFATANAAFDTVRSCWLHLTLLCRDIFLRRPDLLKMTSPGTSMTTASSLLSKLGEALLLRSLEPQPALRDHPNSGESLFIFVLASLCSNFSESGKDSAQVLEFTTGRAAMLHYMRLGNSSTLRWFVDCCARAMQHAPTSVMDFPMDPSNYLLDITSLILSEDTLSSESLGSLLLGPSRLWATLLQILQEMLSRDTAALAAYHTSPSTPLPMASQALSGCTKRLVRAVTNACCRSCAVAVFSLRYPDLLHSIRLLLGGSEFSSFSTSSSALQLARTLQHTRSGLLLQPHTILSVSVAFYCGCSTSARPAESGSKEEKETLFQLVRVCSLTIGQELNLFLELLSQVVPARQVGIDATIRRPPQRDARLKIAPQLQQLADCTAWISRRELGAADERLQQLLRDFCSDCLSTMTKIAAATTPAAVVAPVATMNTMDTSSAEGGQDSSLADEDGEREEDFLDSIDAAVQNLRKKLKGLQYFLDANISSNKID